MSTPYPTYEDVMREAGEIAAASPTLATYSEVGKSEEGRPIPLLIITDPAIASEHKSVFLLSGGTDGNEEVGRAVALGMARKLLEPQYRSHLQKQVTLIVPVTNPDGTVREQADKLGNARGIDAASVHPHNGPALTAEGRAMRQLVETWIPDAHVDFHGLAGGSMGDYAFLYPTVNRNWSIAVLVQVAAELDKAGAAAGYPQSAQPRIWTEPRMNLPGWMARNQGALCMVVESPENYYPIEDSVRSGVARMLRLLEIGEEVGYFQTMPNYPCDVVSGGRMGALMPWGADYTQRRQCRRAMAMMINEGVPWFGREARDDGWVARIRLPIEDTVRTFPPGMVFQATLDRRAVPREVRWNDCKLAEDQWTIASGTGGLIVRAEVPQPPQPGQNILSILYEVPFRRHVTRLD